MPQYTVLLFGPAAVAIGEDRVTVDAPAPCGCEALKQQMARDYPVLDGHLQAGRLAVNHGFLAGETPIDPGDEVALITMVSGG